MAYPMLWNKSVAPNKGRRRSQQFHRDKNRSEQVRRSLETGNETEIPFSSYLRRYSWAKLIPGHLHREKYSLAAQTVMAQPLIWPAVMHRNTVIHIDDTHQWIGGDDALILNIVAIDPMQYRFIFPECLVFLRHAFIPGAAFQMLGINTFSVPIMCFVFPPARSAVHWPDVF